jgi:hypothetical protein
LPCRGDAMALKSAKQWPAETPQTTPQIHHDP